MSKSINKTKIIREALAKGLTGRSLGAFLTGTSSRTNISMLVGAAIDASVVALQEARDLNMPVMIADDGYLCFLHPDGSVEKLGKMKRSRVRVPSTFTIG
ncbi:MAG: hypothetical protein H7321_04175 [Bacteroidia bacterium]|nr:hypothetical protein [Bacteroidia bacterium]